MKRSYGYNHPRPDLTDAQVESLISSFEATVNEAGDLVQMLHTYPASGGRDWETYERILDHLARVGMRMVMTGRGAISPESRARAVALLTAADSARSADIQDQVHHSISTAALVGVWAVGEHFLIDAEDWSDQLPRIVLAAAQQARRINDNPLLHGPGLL